MSIGFPSPASHGTHRQQALPRVIEGPDRALANEKIEPVWNSTVSEYLTNADDEMRAIKLKNVETGEDSELEVACVFVAIGHIPNTSFLDLPGIELDENGYLLQQNGSTATAVPGIFAAGDVADHVYRQAITAAGDGCAAALDAERYLAERE